MEFLEASDYKEKESEILRLLRMGSKEAFEDIFKSYWRDLYTHAFSKLRNKEVAEDIVQEIFTTLWVKRQELLIVNLTYYLHTSVKNKVLNHLRGRIVQERYWDYYKMFLPGLDADTEKTIDYNDLSSAVEKSTSFLSQKAKIIFQLSRIEGYSVPEIARKLNVSEKVVEYHITRSIKVLKIRLKDYSPPALLLFVALAT